MALSKWILTHCVRVEPHRLHRERRREVFLTKANGANFWEEMSSAGVGKNEEKNDNLSSSDVIVFPHILSNTGAASSSS